MIKNSQTHTQTPDLATEALHFTGIFIFTDYLNALNLPQAQRRTISEQPGIKKLVRRKVLTRK